MQNRNRDRQTWGFTTWHRWSHILDSYSFPLNNLCGDVTSLSPGFICVSTFTLGGDGWAAPYLVLLLEAVALGAFHLGDVLEEVRHADRRVQLTRLVRHVHGLALPQGVGVGLHQAAGVAAHVLALICGTQTQGEGRAGQDGGEGVNLAPFISRYTWVT